MDLFGLRKSAEPPPAGGEPHEAFSFSDKRIWAVLLVLNTIFLFIFAGAVAGMLWVRWGKAPMPSRMQQTRDRKSPEPQKGEKAKSEPIATPPAAAPVPAAKAAPAAPLERREAKRPLGSPSVLAPDLPRREAGPAKGGDAAPAPPHAAPISASADKTKAQPVEFVCHAKEATEVLLRGSFLVRTGGLKAMTRIENGAWHVTVSLFSGHYKYRCIVDGKRSKIFTVDVP
ncbi:MAG: hypothetical protein HY551_00705 [Elusimicrobia bacterium]|nr:hypothetical protein [Elusimicrobiota bacterium]